MTEIKLFPISRRTDEVQALAAELSRLDDERRMARWRSAMEHFCRRIEELGVSEQERRKQVSAFSVAVNQAITARMAETSTPDDVA